VLIAEKFPRSLVEEGQLCFCKYSFDMDLTSPLSFDKLLSKISLERV